MTAVGAQPIERGLLIGDTEIPAASGRITEHLDPVTGEVHSRMAAAGKEDVDRVIAAAHAAFPQWAGTPASQRRLILERAAQLLSERVGEFTELLLGETGGTRAWAAFNVSMSVDLLRQAATMATEPTGKMLATDDPGKWSMAVGAPAGVVAAFVPWNGPLILCTRAVAVALATGNPVVIRPSEDAPITSGYFLADLLIEAGVPAGAVTVVTNERSDAPEVVEALIANPRVRRVNFTGSTTVGRIVGRHAGTYLKPVILELGGKNPIVVLDDADLDHAARGVAFAKFFNSGQICLSVDRIIVLESVADEFTEKFLAAVDRVVQGDPTDPRTLVGPMINARAAERVAGLVQDAVSKGATVLRGSGAPEGAFHPATVVADVTPDMRLYHEESFGPLATIYRVATVDDAIALANDTEYGLSSAVYTENATRGLDVARRLEHGAVHVNDHSVADDPQAPVGGVKDSGFGRFGSQWGADFFTETRWVTVADRHSEYPL
ncbi:aldehyde dehydrogenase family protein [Kutzneria buriramensis]|uniref:Acyl-CoA reductase-like NAD-dependent aldehyde dehydrogenase n=1 Tax=Kutzneria buriramensis TaxID=1045776 RepID=A0A3E0GZK9_9PSEU|nr:aldehyde dehydrogenase family protein [Kutzneria buriramensis]REH33083.1 acyl-CoA reductase-like NAD-dependent aldehyde dehydrogenase [Kutzneria buriramensis]